MSKKDSITRAIEGKKKSIKKVVEDYSEDIYRLIYLHTKYEDDSKQILEEVVYYIKENITKLKNKDEFELWLYKISIIKINRFLSEVGMVEVDVDEDDYYENHKISLYKSIDILEPKYKNVLILKYYFNFSIEKISKILDLNEETVKIYIRQSLKIMKTNMGESF